MREDRIAIIDNGINRELICKDKIQAQIVIDENNRSEERRVGKECRL